MQAQWRIIVGEIRDSAKQATETNEQLSAAVQQDSAALEEVASSVGNFAHTVSGVRGKADQMIEHSRRTSDLASMGKDGADCEIHERHCINIKRSKGCPCKRL